MSNHYPGRERNGTSSGLAVPFQPAASKVRLHRHPVTGEQPGPQARFRSLLVLDGQNLSPELLKVAENKCVEVADRVDILLVNPQKPPASVLCELLIHLEQAGIDYRLTSATGRLSDQMVQYVRRFLGITLIMVAALQTLGADWQVDVADLRHQGYRFMTLADAAVD